MPPQGAGSSVYKDDVFAAQCRRDQVLRQTCPLGNDLVRLYAVRQARVWAGIAGVAGFLALLVEILASAAYSSHILLGTWLAMAVVFVAVFLTCRHRLLRFGDRALLTTEDVFGDLSRLERAGPRELVVRRAHRLELWSFILPAVALTLLLPLTLHLAVGTTFLSMALVQFNAWILISLLLVGHAHLTLIILSVIHVLRVRSELDRGAPVGGVTHGFWALLWTVTASTIPGALLLCVPPILVALTGLLFIPWMFHWISRRAEGERLLLEENGLVPPFLARPPEAG